MARAVLCVVVWVGLDNDPSRVITYQAHGPYSGTGINVIMPEANLRSVDREPSIVKPPDVGITFNVRTYIT